VIEKYAGEYPYAFPAFGNNELRMKWMERLQEKGITILVLIHPTAFISPSATVHPGTIVEANAIINTNSVIERGSIVSVGAIVDHDAHVGRGCHIDCGATVKANCVVNDFTKQLVCNQSFLMQIAFKIKVVLQMYPIIKRVCGLIISLVALIILSPIFLLLAIAIKLDSKGPVLFKQKRIGIHKRHFKMLKFRTMRIDAPKDAPTHLLTNPDKYITRVGKFLRKTSLDELPQLVNMFTGEMALIGPRPALWNQYDLIAERDKYGANDIRPGLTGWAQINGRDTISIEDKAYYDGEYVRKLGIGIDINVFFKTIILVLKKAGVVEGGHAAAVGDEESLSSRSQSVS